MIFTSTTSKILIRDAKKGGRGEFPASGLRGLEEGFIGGGGEVEIGKDRSPRGKSRNQVDLTSTEK